MFGCHLDNPYQPDESGEGDELSKLRKRLEIVWSNEVPKRFIPRSLNGGTGWGVFDKKQDRFLSDSEVTELSPDALLVETVVN